MPNQECRQNCNHRNPKEVWWRLPRSVPHRRDQYSIRLYLLFLTYSVSIEDARMKPGLRDRRKQSKWKFKMDFSIRRRPPPPPVMDIISNHFFSFAIESYITYMKRILHLVSIKNITFKYSYNWFKIDIHQQLWPLTANYLAMFKVISTTIYT